MNRKLYEGVTIIKFNGHPDVVNRVVINIDQRIQAIFDENQKIERELRSFSVSMFGKSFGEICDYVSEISNVLYKASTIINENQKDVVTYIKKCNRLEGLADYTSDSKQLQVSRINVMAVTQKTQITIPDLLQVLNNLKGYVSDVSNEMDKIKNDVLNIGQDWQDPQYNLFLENIDEVRGMVIKGLQNLVVSIDALINRVKTEFPN